MPNQLKKVHGLLGVNLQAEPRFLKDGEAVRTKNLVPLLNGQLGKRRSVALVGELMRDLELTDIPVALHTFNLPHLASARFGLLIFTRDGVLWAALFGTPTPTLEAAYTERQLSANTWDGIQPVVFSMEGRIFILPGKQGDLGTSGPSHWARGVECGVIFESERNPAVVPEIGPPPATGGSGFGPLNYWYSVGGGSGENVAMPAGGVPYRQRAVYWNLADGYEDCLLFSDNDAPAYCGVGALAANGRYIRVGSRNQGSIISCVQVMLTSVGTPSSTALLVLFETGAYLVTGEPNQSTDTTDMLGDLQVQQMNIRCTCIGHATVVQTPYGILWMGTDDVWMFVEGQLPFRVGTKLRPLLVGQPRSFLKKLYASYHDGFFRLALYSPGSAGGLTVAPEEHWLLDLRQGAPRNSEEARWFGPQMYTPVLEADVSPIPGLHCATQDLWGGTGPRLISACPTVDGSAVVIRLVDVEGGTGEDLAVTDAAIPVVARQDSHPTFELISKDDDFGDFNTDKLYTGAEIGMLPTRPTGVTVEAILGGGEDTGSDEQTLVAGGFILDSDSLDDRTLAETYDHQLSYPDETTRPLGKSIQLKVSDNAGYVITEFNDELLFDWTDGALTLQPTATIPRGHYANLKELLDAIVLALRVAVSAGGGTDTFEHDVTAATGRVDIIELRSTSGFDWRPWNLESTGDENPKTSALLSMLGFDPESHAAMSQFNYSVDPVHWNPAGGMSLTEVVLKVETFPNRRPS